MHLEVAMIHLPFADRIEAGNALAIELSRRLNARNAVVLALARGGVPVGFAVANRLDLPLDVVVARKLGVPWQPELAMGAIAGSARTLNEGMLADLEISAVEVEKVILREQAEMKRREELYRVGQPAPDLAGRTVILVDDGLATGSTMLAAVRHARKLQAAIIVVAVPVGSRDSCEHLRREADDVVCLAIPDFFYAVGEWYRDFHQVSDNEVRNLLAESREHLAKGLKASMA
jgi:predicted phosphoribosyltransferase